MTYIKHLVLALTLAMATAGAETPKLRGRVLEEETPSETVPNRVIGPDETTANKGLIGVDEVPAQIGALVEGVLVPYIGSFPGLETPIVVRYTSLIDAVSWNCIATYSDSYLDALTKERPTLVAPVAVHDTPTRIACVLSAQYTFASAFLPAAAPGIAAAAAANRGLVLPETLDPSIVGCGADPTKQKAREPEGFDPCRKQTSRRFSSIRSFYTGFDVDEQCLVDAVADASYDPVVVGQAVAEQVLAYAVKDGWNQLGDVGTDGKDCTANCRPFRDTTGYKPQNGPFRKDGPFSYYEEKGLNRDYLEGNCSRPLACRPVPWRPLSEDDGNGFFVLHQHVTPHIGTQGKTRFLSTEEKDARRAPAPVYNYDIESELVLDRLKLLDDQKKMEVEWFDAVFDDKLNIIVTLFGTLASSGAFQSFESAVAFLTGYTATEYETVQIVWKEKVRHDLARPPTIFEGKYRGMDIRTWGGPYRSVQTVKRKDVEPYKRVMPHSEYPSGSSCICQGVADYTNAFLNATGVVLPTLSAELKAGSSKVEPGMTPANDVTLSYDTIDALVEVCGSSRLDGGMHFAAAVPAGAELCSGIGTEGFQYASDLIGGEW